MFEKVALFGLMSVATAHAEWRGSQAVAETTNPHPDTIGTEAIESAAQLPEMSSSRMQFLRPRRKAMDQNPYAQTDFTAYTLEWGETKVGLASITTGILPRTQIGTVPALDAIGLLNANAKINFFRLGPLDMSVTADRYQLRAGDFSASQTGLGGNASIRITQPWSLHFGGHYQVIEASGLPDFSRLSPILTSQTGIEISPDTIDEARDYVDLNFRARRITAEVASDLRLNRRDSIILRGHATVWREVDTGIESDLPPILRLNDLFDQSGEVSLTDAYTISAAWQFAWRRAELRLGAGMSSIPGAWLLQSTEFSYRFGGETRRGERRMRVGWRHDQRNLRRAQNGGRTSPDQPV